MFRTPKLDGESCKVNKRECVDMNEKIILA